MEFNWLWYFEDVYTCYKYNDLDCIGSHRNAFLKIFHHLTNTLPLPIILPFLFDYLYPVELRHRHTRIQRQRALKFFLLGSPGTVNLVSTYTHYYRNKCCGDTDGRERPTTNKTGITRVTS